MNCTLLSGRKGHLLIGCTSLKNFIWQYVLSVFPGFVSVHRIRTQVVSKMYLNNTACNIAAHFHKCNCKYRLQACLKHWVLQEAVYNIVMFKIRQIHYFTTRAVVSKQLFKLILTADQSSLLPEFSSPTEKLFLEGRGSAGLDIHFLPFNLEKRYCTVILVNELVRIESVFCEGFSCDSLVS